MDSGGGEQNYWPGFVDALANVVLTLIFVLVIFVFALAMASNKVEERLREVEKAENAQKQSTQAVPTTVEELQRQLQEAQAELAKLRGAGTSEFEDSGFQDLKETSNLAENSQVTVQGQKDTTKFEGAVNIQNKQGTLTIGFPADITQMDEKSQNDLSNLIDSVKGRQAKKIIIRSFMGAETFSAAQRMAYYRAVNVRNVMITKMSINPAVITSEIVKPDSTGIGRIEIVFNN